MILHVVAVLAMASGQAGQGLEVEMVGSASEVQACQRLGEVQASSLMTGLFSNQGKKRTIAQLKARTADLGGTHVQVLSATFAHASNNMLGIAYRCEPKPPPASADVER